VLRHTPGRQMFWVTYISFVTLPLHAPAGVFSDSKLYFHSHVDFILSDCIILFTTFRFSSLDCALLHISQVQVGICLSSSEFYHIYWCQHAWAHPAEVCVRFYRFFLSYSLQLYLALEKLNLHYLHKQRHHLHTLFLFKSTVALNLALPSRKILVFVFLLAMLETS
jgi:hypothetical protein